jgi:hypothetical protein
MAHAQTCASHSNEILLCYIWYIILYYTPQHFLSPEVNLYWNIWFQIKNTVIKNDNLFVIPNRIHTTLVSYKIMSLTL